MIKIMRSWIAAIAAEQVRAMQVDPAVISDPAETDLELTRQLEKARETLLMLRQNAVDMRTAAIPTEKPNVETLLTGPQNAVEWFDDRYYRIDLERVASGRYELVHQNGYYRVMEHGQPILTSTDRHVFFESSTTLLGGYPKTLLSRWRGEKGNIEADRIMEAAAEKGSSIHNACYVLANNGLVVFQSPVRVFTREEIEGFRELYHNNVDILHSQEEMLCVHRFYRWWLELKPTLIGGEVTVFSFVHKYAGTVDYIIKICDGEYMVAGSKPMKLKAGYYVVDLKTGKSIWDDHSLQLASYVAAIEEDNTIGDIRGALIVHLNAQTKSGIAGVMTTLLHRDRLHEDFQDFVAVAKVWRRANATMKPKIYDLPTLLTLNH